MPVDADRECDNPGHGRAENDRCRRLAAPGALRALPAGSPACVWTRYDGDFEAFHHTAAALLAEHRHAMAFFPQGTLPPNTFDVSSVPWTSFTGFNLNIENGSGHLAPIFTLGRYIRRSGRVMLPLAIQAHHAAVDGFHVGRLVRELQDLLADPSWGV
jgi:chloramphenicol O-acetyltransferase type A